VRRNWCGDSVVGFRSAWILQDPSGANEKGGLPAQPAPAAAVGPAAYSPGVWPWPTPTAGAKGFFAR
jgi:hypothetical protein